MKRFIGFAALVAAIGCGPAQAQFSDGVIKIGVMNDMSGTYADLDRTRARSSPRRWRSRISAPPPRASRSRSWRRPSEQAGYRLQRRAHLDRHRQGRRDRRRADFVGRARRQRDRPREEQGVPVSGAAASDLTGDKCSPNTVHWTYDTWALANGTGNAIVKTGGKNWFFLTADYAFGHALERDTAAVVEKNGGKVLGKVRHPFPATDFSSFLLQAQSSKAQSHRPRQCRRRHHQCDQAGCRIRHRQGRPEPCRAADLHQRRESARAADRAGPGLHRSLVLGSQRCQPRLAKKWLPAHVTRASIRA